MTSRIIVEKTVKSGQLLVHHNGKLEGDMLDTNSLFMSFMETMRQRGKEVRLFENMSSQVGAYLADSRIFLYVSLEVGQMNDQEIVDGWLYRYTNRELLIGECSQLLNACGYLQEQQDLKLWDLKMKAVGFPVDSPITILEKLEYGEPIVCDGSPNPDLFGRTWFTESSEPIEEAGFCIYQFETRQHGSVGTETYGEEDYLEAQRLMEKAKEIGLHSTPEIIDEWVMVNIHVPKSQYPNVGGK